MAFSFKWLGQGGFELRLGDRKVYIDPYLSDSVLGLDGFKRLPPVPIAPGELCSDLIITTHDHMDHLDPETLGASDFERNMYAGPEDCLRHMRKLGIPEARLERLGAGDVAHVGEARIMGVPAFHTAPEAIGVIVEYKGVRLYISGDTLYDAQLRDIALMDVDIASICINGRLGNMECAQAVELARELKCRVAIPMHYGMFAENTADPHEFEQGLAGSGIYVHIPEFDRECEIYELLRRSEHG